MRQRPILCRYVNSAAHEDGLSITRAESRYLWVPWVAQLLVTDLVG